MKNPELAMAFQRVAPLSDLSPSDFEISPLPGYTNRNYRLVDATRDWILRIPQPRTNAWIDRAAEAFNQARAADLGLAPRPQWQADDGLSLTPTLAGTRNPDARDLGDSAFVSRLMRSLQSLHRSNFTFLGQIDLGALLERYYGLLDENRQAFFAQRLRAARQLIEQVEQRDCEYVPSHNDLVLENLLLDQDRVWLIDWEFSAMASPYWDLATLCNAARLDDRRSADLMLAYCAGDLVMEESLLFDYRNLLQLLGDLWMAALVA